MPAFPIIGAASRILDQVALDDEMTGVTSGIYRAVASPSHAPDARAPHATPSCDVAVFHDDVLHAFSYHDAVNAGVPQFQASNDDVAGLYHDVVVGEVEHVADNLRSRGGRDQMPAFFGSSFADNQCLLRVSARQIGRFADGELLTHGASVKIYVLSIRLESNLVWSVWLQAHQRSPILALALVVDQWISLAPFGCSRHSISHPATILRDFAI